MMISRKISVALVLVAVCLAAASAACSGERAPDATPTAATALRAPAATNTVPPSPTATVEPSPQPTAESALVPGAKGADLTRADAQQLAAPIHSTDTLFYTLMSPWINEAQRRRADLANSDPAFGKRIDKELNDGRVNFLLFGYGESHEPPNTERALIGSQTIISYDYRNYTADIVSLTHDIRAPEIERELAKRGQKNLVVRIDKAYSIGGFRLMRQVLEDATGLSVDFQVTFKDAVMQRLIDDVFGGVEVDVPTAFDVQPFYLDGVKYPKGHFAQGKQRLNGRQVIQFIKTVPIATAAYDKSLEHNVRKHLIFVALLHALNQNYTDREFWLKGSGFITKELVTGAITYDFDPIPLAVNNIGNTLPKLKKLVGAPSSGEIQSPQIRKSIYVVDPAHGDGGVQWVNANAAVNPITKKDIDSGIYASLDMEVPLNANPYGDLVTEYWCSVRALVKQTFLSKTP